jgi:HEAT repeat protein
MRVVSTASVLASGLLWKTVGLRSAGRALIRALDSEIEDVRTIAGMSLVQAGERSTPLLCEALDRGEHRALVLTMLGDIGDPGTGPAIERFLADPDREVAVAAREALRVLAARKPSTI